ncbi:hypothetical protein H6F43_00905 [Leptolyngbya sp. FACHB-36]|uniref:hypothetical protein n=1 Tax=Leptolyngbya sp. FACHB-36 TaxID=2692808 RepID=UPI00168045DF|nr:hypothetical protein [Leptolyngbya sp. FACHB-36]MBD2018741.1 hypothetical protein [Leptolyngbya sp. FACHB-36]
MAITEIRLITDLPDDTGWLDGYAGRRSRADLLTSPEASVWYEKGWRRGCRDAYKDANPDNEEV